MEREKKNYFKHTLCLFSAFTLGSALITLPTANILETVISAAAVLLLLVLLSFLPERAVNSKIFFGILLVLSLSVGAATAFSLISFISRDFLFSSPVILIAAAVLLTVFALFFSSKSGFFKFCLIGFTVAALLRAVLSLLMIGVAQKSNILSGIFILSLSGILRGVCVFLPTVIALFYVRICGENKKACYIGFSLSASQIIGFTVLTVGAFGGGANAFSYPLTAAVGAASIGTVFTRFDALIYAVIFICGTIKSAVCFKCAALCALKIFGYLFLNVDFY